MITLNEILKSFEGRANFSIVIKGKEAAVIIIDGKEIIADVKDPFAFMDFGLFHDLMRKRGSGSGGSLQRFKDAGFKVSLKYKGFKIDLV